MRRPILELLIAAGLALATGFAYIGVLSSDFEFVNLDDDVYVYENNVVRMGLTRASVNWAFTTTYLGNWHPLTWLSLELDYRLFGLNPAGYHAMNLAFHVANTVLVFWLLNKLTSAAGRSACAAAFFGLHPLHVESVAWISERKDVLSMFFLLLSILAWQAYARRGKGWGYALCVSLFLFSLMSKAMGITLPLVLLLLDVWPLGRWRREAASTAPGQTSMGRLIAEKLPFFLISAAFGAVSVLLQGRSGAMEYGRSLTLPQRLAIVPMNYVTYLWQTLWPVDLVVLYPHPGELPLWKPLGAMVLLLAVTLLVVRVLKSLPYLGMGWFWFLITLLPVIGLVQLGRHATADRYMYLPMVGLLVMLCWGAYDLTFGRRGLRWMMAAAAVISLCVCAELTSRQVQVWHDDIRLWEHTLALTPESSTAQGNYGKALFIRGQEEEAERRFLRALEIDPTLFAPNFNMGVVMGHRGRPAEAAEYFERARQLDPNNPLVLDNLGIAEEQSGRLEAAREHYERALQINPQGAAVRARLERLKSKTGAPDTR
ncbi:MAG TPA: tetratricopeptide repeat protein [Pirellulales bacterium]|nr:tetratricopeptide repeat protein [Pirellulales bacterium]